MEAGPEPTQPEHMQISTQTGLMLAGSEHSADVSELYPFDMATLAELDTIFDAALRPQSQPPDLNMLASAMSETADAAQIAQLPDTVAQWVADTNQPSLADHQVLPSRECFELPQPEIVRTMMRSYFRFVHYAIPVVDESEVWALWDDDGVFSLADFPLVVMRAMIFASAQFLDDEAAQCLGHANKRTARIEFYHRTQDLLAFDVYKDPLANAQASLLLTYFSPHDNRARVNSFWLMNAARYARLAFANVFFFFGEHPAHMRRLKRLWWSVLFRDRIMSLGLRRAPIIESDPLLQDGKYVLGLADFEPELGKSEVHCRETQIALIGSVTTMCGLAQALTSGLVVLYGEEVLLLRVKRIQRGPEKVLHQIENALEELTNWYDTSICQFPSPVTLDEDKGRTESLSVLVNMMFCYHCAAKFALELLRMLVYELTGDRPTSLHTIQAMEHAIDDMTNRVQEIVHVRLTGYLPISISAYIALPLVLQSINVSSAQGDETQESVENRRLEIFQRILGMQRSQFDGTDFIIDTLQSISKCFTRDRHAERDVLPPSRGRHLTTTAPYWSRLAKSRPRELLRLLYRLDCLLCYGGPPGAQDPYPNVLSEPF
ncbi:hypothetical protein DOTSEDRAFT_55601 [Dothistroma septosporum NZE10]|uniref:Xylanolytic transcriptional activator regulatory domain-containing protein n=1 Tax=Dothistroma septosporum (strain NZE10 / CBS 128990) TaxID=675120 RepID=N1PKR8_DOTSN|nr:hypothetical protein DOTSEDRAFT_55601 [Dothistroma septosporum NZE10]